MIKPVVSFTGNVEIRRAIDPRDEKEFRYAVITDVLDHPRLGAQDWVRTSVIVDVNEDNTRIETLNTIYVKEEE